MKRKESKMGEFRKEYLQLKDDLAKVKQDIQGILVKYDTEWNGNNLMKVLDHLYKERKGDEGEWYDLDILVNYDENCGVPYEEIEKIIELFVKRKLTKRRMGYIKGYILRQVLYYNILNK